MEYIAKEISEGILIIKINRPKALNALKPELIAEIGDELKKHENDNLVLGVIITGEGEKAFAAGADIKGFPALDVEGGRAVSLSGHQVFDYIESYPKAIIAAVNGYALGGGCELAMACHLRVASENALFGMPETKLGLIPGYGGTQRLAALIGKAKAIEFILTGDMIDAASAFTLGLANHVVEHGKEVETAQKILLKIGKRGPLAVTAAIDCINAYYDVDTNGYELEIEKFGELMASDEAKEGVNAFLEKRPPNFRNV